MLLSFSFKQDPYKIHDHFGHSKVMCLCLCFFFLMYMLKMIILVSRLSYSLPIIYMQTKDDKSIQIIK